MLDVRLKTVEQTVVLGRSLPSNSTSRGKCARRPLGKNLRPALEPDSTERQLRGYRQGRSFSDFWKSSEATASPCVRGRRYSPAGRKVQWRVGTCGTVFWATAAKAGTVRPSDASGLPVRTNAPSDDKTVRGVVQRSRHLTSTRYPRCYRSIRERSSAGTPL